MARPARRLALPLLAAVIAGCTGHERDQTRDEPRPSQPPPPPPAPPPIVEPPPPPPQIVEPPAPARCFTAHRTLGLEHWPLNGLYTDVNGDKRPDILVNFTTDRRAGVLLSDGDGSFRLPDREREHLLEHDAIGFVAADFNKDGHTDLAAADYKGTHIRVYDGRGDGTFATKAHASQVGKYVGAGASADFDNDGHLDLALTLWSSLAVLHGRGDGRFSAPTRLPAGQAPERPLVADFNDDGRLDLATPSNDEHHLALFLGADTPGRFEPARRTRCGQGGVTLVAHDFDRDSALDLAVANMHSSDICLLRGDGRGGLTVGAALPGGAYPHGLAAADVTGDGLTDLVVAAWGTDPKASARLGPGALIVLAADGRGSFTTLDTVDVGASPNDLWLDDLDRDGHLDAITLNSNGRSLSILRGGPCPEP